MSESTTPVTATLGSQIEWKQKIATREPTKKELRRAGQNPQNAAAAEPPPKRPFTFVKPTLRKVAIAIPTAEARQASLQAFGEFKAEIGPYMADLVGQWRALKDATGAMSDEECLINQAEIEAGEKAISEAFAEALNQEQPAGRELAVIAFADAVGRDCADHSPSWGTVKAVLQDLTKKTFVEETTENGKTKPGPDAVVMGRKAYTLSPGLAKNNEAQEVFHRLGNLIESAKRAARSEFEAQREEVLELAGPPETQLSIPDLKAGKEGVRLLPIPAQEWKDREGNPHHRLPGGLVIRVETSEKGPRIVPLAAFGGIERDVQRIVDVRVFIIPRSLDFERPTVPEHFTQEQHSAFVNFHRLIRLGIAEAEKRETVNRERADFRSKCDRERQELAAKASLTSLEFFGEEKEGTVLVEWAGGPFLLRVFNRETRQKEEVSVFFCFCLVGRDAAGRIRVVECPKRLNSFFASHREFTAPGLDYSSLGKLGIILRRARAIALEGAIPEEQEAADKARAEAKATREAARAAEAAKLAVELAAGFGEDVSGANIPEIPTGK